MNLLTERLLLSPATATDAVALHRMWTSPGGRKYLWDDEVIPLSQVEEIVILSQRYFAEQGTGLWLVRERVTNQAVGFAGFWYFHTPPALELLYGVDDAYWGHVFATEAAQAVVDYGFEQIGFEQIVASTDVPNTASVRVMEKLGMNLQRRAVIDEKDTVFYGLARSRN